MMSISTCYNCLGSIEGATKKQLHVAVIEAHLAIITV
jgi:hypothetical protein